MVDPLAHMQITSQNYLGNRNQAAFNPFNPEQAIPGGVGLLSRLIDHYGTNQEGINRALAAYNQGQGTVDRLIRQHGANYFQFLPPQGRDYVNSINEIRNGRNFRVPGYFGTPR